MNNITQKNLNDIWDKLKAGYNFKCDFPPTKDVDDEGEQVMTIPFPDPTFGGITVGRRDTNSDWAIK